MKWLAFSVTLFLAALAVCGTYVDYKAVKSLFDEEARAVLDADPGRELAEDEPKHGLVLRAPQNEGGKKPGNCSEVCENYDCPKRELPKGLKKEEDYLEYENQPINCRLGSRTFFLTPKKKFLCEDLWDCCRRCNFEHFQCLDSGKGLGVREGCIRQSYKCMCDCLRNFPITK